MTTFEGGAAGMVRLALVDLSERGQQPIWSSDARTGIIFNGEIYNFREERRRLEAKGHVFRTTTDTEVILALYLAEGLAFVNRLRGMYAIAILDWRLRGKEREPELILARDPLGIKPLYIAGGKNGKPLVFASELRSIKASGLVDCAIDRTALLDYLRLGYIVQPRTILAGVRMLPPGTLERYRPDSEVKSTRFWSPPKYAPQVETFEDSGQRLGHILAESVRLHALADAPVGAFLSGGVDSTAVVGLMRPHVANLNTYTVRFPDAHKDDEATEAEQFALKLGCKHHVVDVTGPEIARLLPMFVENLDQPSVDGFNTWIVSRAAAHDVKAVLSGLGGDEAFAGYRVAKTLSRLKHSPTGRITHIGGNLAEALTPLVPEWLISNRRWRKLRASRSFLSHWIQAREIFPEHIAQALTGRGSDSDQETELGQWFSQISPTWREESGVGFSFLADTFGYMGMQLLRDADALSMAHSLELRVPLVDLEVFAFSRSCREDYKLHPHNGGLKYSDTGSKRVLIEAAKDVLPKDMAQRPKKGFSFPIQEWMDTSLRDLSLATTNSGAIQQRGWLEPNILEMDQGRSVAPYPHIWSLMILELWARSFFGK